MDHGSNQTLSCQANCSGMWKDGYCQCGFPQLRKPRAGNFHETSRN